MGDNPISFLMRPWMDTPDFPETSVTENKVQELWLCDQGNEMRMSKRYRQPVEAIIQAPIRLPEALRMFDLVDKCPKMRLK